MSERSTSELRPAPQYVSDAYAVLQINAAGHRVLHLLEKEWMTHETHKLSDSGKHFTVRAFHGDYEVHVRYRGHEVADQKHTFTLGKSQHTINLHVSH